MNSAAKVFKVEKAAVLPSKKTDVRRLLPQLDATHLLSEYIMHFMSPVFERYPLQEICRHLPITMWPLGWRNWLYLKDPNANLGHECGRLRVSIRSLLVCHEKAWTRSFACRNIDENDVMWSQNRTLAYADLEEEWQVSKRY